MASPPFLLLLLLPFSFFTLLSSSSSQPLSPSQSQALLHLQTILEFPPPLSSWNIYYTPFCYSPNTTTLSLSCSGRNLTSLTIIGNHTKLPITRNSLSSNFSIDSLFSTLSLLPSLTSLTLVNLGIWGQLPPTLQSLQNLQNLNFSNNYLYGPLPFQLNTLSKLKRLDLGGNLLKGPVPDLSGLTELQVVELGFNKLGPEFPMLGTGVVRLVLRNNSIKSKLPAGIGLLGGLVWLDLGNNRLFGSVPTSLFDMGSAVHLDLSGNSFSGELPGDLRCGGRLDYVDLSRNKFVGNLPECIRVRGLIMNSSFMYSWNCLTGVDPEFQHPSSYCNEKPFAVVLPRTKGDGGGGDRSSSSSRVNDGLVLMLSIAGGIMGGALLLTLVLFVVVKRVRRREGKDGGEAVVLGMKSPLRSIVDSVSPKVPADSRRMSSEVMTGMLDVKPYRPFSVQELEEMTNNFNPSNSMEERDELKVYKGRLDDGSAVAIRCLTIKRRYSSQSMQRFIDAFSKLRNRNIVSVIGHCIDIVEDHPSTTTFLFLIFELVSNGTLRSHITEWRKRDMFKWPQRMNAIIGVARGIQFLHNGVAPGIVGNDINIDHILLDKTLAAKIDNYNLPKIMLSKDKNNKVSGNIAFNALDAKYVNSAYGVINGDKEDIYKLGLVLLEVITGKPPSTASELEALKLQLQCIVSESSPRNLANLIDPAIEGTFAFDSLKTTVDVALACLCKDQNQRPSIEDVLWNLQYSIQIQDALASTEDLSGQY